MKDVVATVIVDLNRSEEEILEGLHKDARWGIRRAQKDGLIVKESSDWDAIYKIYCDSMVSNSLNPLPLDVLRNNSRVLFICYKEETPIAIAAIHMEDEKPTLFINASLKDYQKFQPNNLLYWECMLWAKRNGYSQFDFGGWQVNAKGHLEGINKFKEKWGKVIFYEKDFPFFKAIGRKLIRKFKFFWWLNNKIRGRK